jgi:hypothetical protein
MDLAGEGTASVPLFAGAAGALALGGTATARQGTASATARAAFPGESRNSVTLLTGALRQGRPISNQTTGNRE